MELPINYETSHWTVRKRARLLYVREQLNQCCHCGNRFLDGPSDEVMNKPINKSLFPKGMFDYPIHLHHDRTTGMTIGAVHARCNAYLWQYKGE